MSITSQINMMRTLMMNMKLLNFYKAEEFFKKLPDIWQNLKGKTIPPRKFPLRKPCKNQRNHQQGKHVNHVDEDDSKAYTSKEDTEVDVDNSDKEEVTHMNKDQYHHDSDHDVFQEEAYASVLKIKEAYGKGADIKTETNDEQVCLLASNWQEEDMLNNNKLHLIW
eukprot:4792078-Ditylum_brightwellii.AAC.1